MAHSSVWDNEKFILAAEDLGLCMEHFIGHMERLWQASYNTCARTGTLPAEAVESMMHWCGEKGKAISVLLNRKITKRRKANRVQFVNYWDYIPEYARKRIERKELAKHTRQTSGRQMADKRQKMSAEWPTNGSSTQPNPTQPSNKDIVQQAALVVSNEVGGDTERDKKDLANVFENIWADYPRKVGRKAAERHFFASVKTGNDIGDILTALDNYKAFVARKRAGPQENLQWQNGSTWFNNWADWIEDPEGKGVKPKPTISTSVTYGCRICREKSSVDGTFEFTIKDGIDIKCPKCGAVRPDVLKLARGF